MNYVIKVPFWDYNDEYSYTVGDNEGTPVAVFQNRDEADSDCLRRDLDGWRTNIVGDTIAGWKWDLYIHSNGLPVEEALLKLQNAFPDEEAIDLDTFCLPDDTTDEQLMVVREVYPWIRFAEVVEVQ